MSSSPQPDYRPSWYRSFQYLLFVVKVYFAILLVGFIILLANGSLDSWWQPDAQAEETIKKATHPAPSLRSEDEDKVENGIHVATGLVYADGFELVRATCTACHSAQLVTQNRATREGWESMIRWMQTTQGLWDLGEQEYEILDYLAKYYAPQETGRRKPLEIAEVEWYILEL